MHLLKSLIFVGSVFYLSTLAAIPPNKECNEQSSCEDRYIATDSSKTFAWEQNPNFFFTCSSDEYNKVTKSECLQCADPIHEYSQTCDKCVPHPYVNDCEKANPPTGGGVNSKCIGLDSSVDNCIGKKDGSYAIKANRQRFYHCFQGKINPNCEICLGAKIYSEKCNQCVEFSDRIGTAEEKCQVIKTDGAINCDASLCFKKWNGDYELAINGGSNQYYSCASGACWYKNCPNNLKFSKVCEKCAKKYSTSSEQCEKVEIVTVRPPRILRCPPLFCRGKEIAYYPDEKDPSVFYYCTKIPLLNNKFFDFCAAALHCPKGLVFDKSILECKVKSH